MDFYHFGVEIEIVAIPHKIRDPLVPAKYYELFAKALENRGLRAEYNENSTRRRTDLYSHAWYITRDGSLTATPPQVALEAVSPILSTREDWEFAIDTFWIAQSKVFHMPIRSLDCGSHVHVSPSSRKWSAAQLRDIAVRIMYYETYIDAMLPRSRRHNAYCQKNSVSSHRNISGVTGWQSFIAAVKYADRDTIHSLMQSDRRVLWNFEHIVEGGSGSIEFRGGRYLRGEVRTKRWIAFAVGYLELLRKLKMSTSGQFPPASGYQELYSEIRKSAQSLQMGQHLPHDYQLLNESKSDVLEKRYHTRPAHVFHTTDMDASTNGRESYNAYTDRDVSSDDAAEHRSSVDRAICRSIRVLQFLFAIIVAGIYGTYLQRRLQDQAQPSVEKWIYAEVVAGISATTIALYALPGENLCLFPWDWVLFILWTAVFGAFGKIFLHAQPDQVTMRSAVWIDLVNMLLWFVTATRGTLWTLLKNMNRPLKA